ncbi:unnamed protein product [Prunus brigantina]
MLVFCVSSVFALFCSVFQRERERERERDLLISCVCFFLAILLRERESTLFFDPKLLVVSGATTAASST